MKSNLLDQFAKGASTQRIRTVKSAVIYTRVSSKEQADNNHSLQSQLKLCVQYAEDKNIPVLAVFGGTHESAKTDERKEFQRMLKFVRASKGQVSHILMYHLDRFSRSGIDALYISDQLAKNGVELLSILNPVDTSTESGKFQQHMQLLFANYENNTRKAKCMDGMREKLLRGEWVGNCPVGYMYSPTSTRKAQKIIFSEKSKYLRKAFEWKLNENLSHSEISVRLEKHGVRVNRRRLTEILRNPFYCGYISHNLLNGELVRGNHDPLITEELFLQVNDLLKSNVQGYKHKKEDEAIPLKRFIICETCNTAYTGYVVKKKGLYYYKCNRIGCKCNRSAKDMHELFIDLLGQYQITPKYVKPICDELNRIVESLSDNNSGQKKPLEMKLAELSASLEGLEEKYAFGKLEPELYTKYSAKLKAEIAANKDELGKLDLKLSNPSEAINFAVTMSTKLAPAWASSDLTQKFVLQNMIFPEGILYDRQKHAYRTTRVNSVFEVIACVSKELGQKKCGQRKKNFQLSASVAGTGLEPMTFGL